MKLKLNIGKEKFLYFFHISRVLFEKKNEELGGLLCNFEISLVKNIFFLFFVIIFAGKMLLYLLIKSH